MYKLQKFATSSKITNINQMLDSFSLSVPYTRNSGHRADIGSMCAEPQAECKLNSFHVTKLNSVALLRERTIQTERPPPFGKVSANFCG